MSSQYLHYSMYTMMAFSHMEGWRQILVFCHFGRTLLWLVYRYSDLECHWVFWHLARTVFHTFHVVFCRNIMLKQYCCCYGWSAHLSCGDYVYLHGLFSKVDDGIRVGFDAPKPVQSQVTFVTDRSKAVIPSFRYLYVCSMVIYSTDFK